MSVVVLYVEGKMLFGIIKYYLQVRQELIRTSSSVQLTNIRLNNGKLNFFFK